MLHRLLDLDPDLGEHLPPHRFGVARAELLCLVLVWRRGEAPAEVALDEPESTLGLLIVSGPRHPPGDPPELGEPPASRPARANRQANDRRSRFSG